MKLAVDSWQLPVQLAVGSLVFSFSLAVGPVAAQQVPKGAMPTLGRPTETTDKVPLFDFDTYFVGKWTFEWSMPESPLGPAGPYSGTTALMASSRRL